MLTIIRFIFQAIGSVVELVLIATVGQGGVTRKALRDAEHAAHTPRVVTPPPLPYDPNRRRRWTVHASRLTGPMVPPPPYAPTGSDAAPPRPVVVAPRATPLTVAEAADVAALDRLEARRTARAAPVQTTPAARETLPVDTALVGALVKLGFRRSEALARLTKVTEEGLTQAELLRRALAVKL